MYTYCLRICWILTNVVICLANTTQLCNDTYTQSMVNNELLVDAYQNLRDLISKQLANKYPIPPKLYSSFHSILASFEPLQIITLDEVLQSIAIASAITLTWRDHSVKWDPKYYEGIEWIKLPSSYIWLPNIVIPETAVEDGQLAIPSVVDVSYKGIVNVLIPTITTTLCNLDLTYFPFDDQNCTLAMMESEFYNMTSHSVSLGDMSKYFGTNAAWKLVSHACNPQISQESDPPFSFVSCHVTISRRSAFYVVNLIGPMGMTSLMTLIAFCIPAEGGEKISFIVSMFMSTSVFYNYIINITPRSMENLPRINILLVAIAIQIIFATVAIIFTLIRFSRSKKLHQHQKRHNFHGHERQCELSSQTNNPKLEMNDKRPFRPEVAEKNTLYYEDYRNNAAINRPGKSTNVENKEKIIPEEKNGRSRSLSCDELDMLFLGVMCIFTALLYICIFCI